MSESATRNQSPDREQGPISDVRQNAPERSQNSREAPHWGAATRFAFRFFLVYFVVVLGPQVVFFTTGHGWWRRLTATVGQWSTVNVFRVPEHYGSDYLLTQLLGTISLAAMSALAALVGSGIDRRSLNYPRLFAWLHTAMRFTLALPMVWYGLGKVLPGQFGPGVDLVSLTQQTGQLLPQQLLWAFMQASRPYTIFAGVLETAGGLLLLTRRTATLGALVSVLAMSNVLMLNLAYNVNVKLYSAQLLLMALVVLAPDGRRLIDLLLLNRPTGPRPIRPLFRRTGLDTIARIAGVVLATWLVYWCYQTAAGLAQRKLEARNTPLHGIWQVEQTAADDNARRLPAEAEGWRYLVFPYEDTYQAVVISASNEVERYAPKIDRLTKTLTITSLPTANGTPSQSRSFDYGLTDDNHLVLRRQNVSDDPLLLRFRRVDPSSFPLVSHPWRW